MVYGSQQSNSSGNGTIASPEIAVLEGDQRQGGCIVVVPDAAGGAGVSRGRFPDGADADANCTDFLLQVATSLSAAAPAGASNIKVASVADFAAGQSVMVDAGAQFETAVIAEVGTAGATTIDAATAPGATVLSVTDTMGFTAGQAITIDGGAARETAVVVSTTRGGRPGPGGGPARSADDHGGRAARDGARGRRPGVWIRHHPARPAGQRARPWRARGRKRPDSGCAQPVSEDAAIAASRARGRQSP